MKWDKSSYAKSKEAELKAEEIKRNTIGEKLTNFLMGGHRGRIEWPNEKIYIGVGFELGGARETWGYGIYIKQDDDSLRLFAEGIDLDTALSNATNKFRQELKNENNQNSQNK